MNIKLIVGIIVPVLIILSLVFLSSSNIGFSIEKETEKFIKFDSLFTTQSSYQAKGSIPIQTITLKNDYFLGKRFDLPRLIACLNDKESKKQRESLTIRYSEGNYEPSSDIPIFSELSYDYYSNSAQQNVQIPAKGKKQIKILLEPKYVYNYNNENYLESYKEYDEVLLVEAKRNSEYSYYSYNSCSDLDSTQLDDAVHIAITDKPTAPSIQCTDSDGGKNYFEKGTTSNNFKNFVDTCTQSDFSNNKLT